MYKNSNDVHIEASEYYWGSAPERIHTVLGSCIAVTLWNRERRTGGMCHFLLPRIDGAGDRLFDSRYCEDSITALHSIIRKEGDSLSVYDVKLFGGAAVLKNRGVSVGEMNLGCAERYLRAEGFRIKTAHTGGSSAFQIIFELDTGDVWGKTLTGTFAVEDTTVATSVTPVVIDTSFISY